MLAGELQAKRINWWLMIKPIKKTRNPPSFLLNETSGDFLALGVWLRFSFQHGRPGAAPFILHHADFLLQ